MRLFQHKEAYRALGFPEFRAYVIGNTFFTIALLIQEVLIAYEIYKITHNPLALGLIPPTPAATPVNPDNAVAPPSSAAPSSNRTFFPAFAKYEAATSPLCPPPTTITS